jgi:hypothetical protein
VILIERDAAGVTEVWVIAEPSELQIMRSREPEPEPDEPEA